MGTLAITHEAVLLLGVVTAGNQNSSIGVKTDGSFSL